ncbi:hypothetical protein FA13DRAFT_1741000 [Coprinellus micaceus]|uniref:G domain-containing protein n=1 Tax=Coprinellus micaceus TaxID=71717 RepID=A0A4Y7SKW4_COPMI|nr:hypothetical protein FA13DRAFT_1741000 [Coprinellus micaceus]
MVRSVTIAAPSQIMTPTSLSLKDQAADERFILVLGQNGVGKSSFINTVSNSPLRIGSALASSAEKVEISLPFFIDGQCFRLVDTPGYDENSEKSETDVLNTISSFLASEYTNGKQLAGVVYIHSIASTRMGSTSRRNLTMFQKLCGRRALRNAAIITTRWDQVKGSTATARETELRTKSTLFKYLLDNGATLFRYDRTQGLIAAQTIVRHFLNTSPMPLLVQREMVDEGKLIAETTAGIELQKDFRKRMEESHKTMRQLKEEFHDLKTENDIPAAKDVRKEMINVKERFDKVREDCRKLTDIKTAPQSMRILISPTPQSAPVAIAASTSGAPVVTGRSTPTAQVLGTQSAPPSRPRSRVNSLGTIPALPPTGSQSKSRSHSRANSYGSIPALPPNAPGMITSTPLDKGKGREITPIDAQPQVTFTRPRATSLSRRPSRRESSAPPATRHRRDSGAARHREEDTRTAVRHSSSRRRSSKGDDHSWDELRTLLFVGVLLLVLVPMIQRSRSVVY